MLLLIILVGRDTVGAGIAGTGLVGVDALGTGCVLCVVQERSR